MSDTPPPELVDRLVSQVLSVAFGAVNHSPTERILRERIERDMPHILAALAEWADGGFIAPSTWTVVEAERETGWCVYWGHGPDCECNDGARWLLSPRDGEHERCPAGICRRPAGHAGPHSDLPREGER